MIKKPDLLETMKRSMSPPPTVPPAAKAQAEAVAAWNDMATQMVAVIRSIQKNEAATAAIAKRVALMVILTLVLQLVGFGLLAFFGRSLEGRVYLQTSRAQEAAALVEKKVDDSLTNQDKLLKAVAALANAQALNISAKDSTDPREVKAVQVAALEAQTEILEVKKDTAGTPSEKKAVQTKLVEVATKTAAAKKELAAAPPSPKE